jgi:hypothetical protein
MQDGQAGPLKAVNMGHALNFWCATGAGCGQAATQVAAQLQFGAAGGPAVRVQ